MKSKKSIIIINGIFLTIMEYLLIVVLSILMTFADYKLNITADIIQQKIKESALNPIETAQSFIFNNNPLYIIGSIGLLVYCIFLIYKSFLNLNKEWKTSSKNTHGSARWGTLKDLIKGGNYRFIKIGDLQHEWKTSLKNESE